MQQAGHQTAFVLAHSGRPCRRPPLLVRLAARKQAPSRLPIPYWCPASPVLSNFSWRVSGATAIMLHQIQGAKSSTLDASACQVNVTPALLACELQWEWAYTKDTADGCSAINKRILYIHVLQRTQRRHGQPGIQILLQTNCGRVSKCDLCVRIAIVQSAAKHSRLEQEKYVNIPD